MFLGFRRVFCTIYLHLFRISINMTVNLRKLTAALSAIMLFAASYNHVSAQDDKQIAAEVVQMGTSDLKKEAMALVNDKNYVAARPYMLELIKRLSESEDKKLRDNLPELYYFVAYSYLQEYERNKSPDFLKKAAEGFDKIINDYPEGEFGISSVNMKADCLMGLKKPVDAVNTRERLLQQPFVGKLNFNEQLDIIRKNALTLYSIPDFKEGEKWFQLFMERAKTIDDKVLAASMLIQAYEGTAQYDKIKPLFKYMTSDTYARSDIRLNISFLRAGDALVKAEKYSDAMLFYSMVLPRDVVLKNLDRFIALYKNRLARAKRLGSESAVETELNVLLGNLESQKKIVSDIADYSVDIMARLARNYYSTNRNYESYWSYKQLLSNFPDHPNIQDFYYAAVAGAYAVGKKDDMFKIGSEYLEKFPDGDYVNDVKIRIAQYYLDKKEYDTFFNMAKAFVEEDPEEKYSVEFVFLMGKTWIEQGNYAELTKTFENYVSEFEDTPIIEGCLYWMGLAYLGQTDFKNAVKCFSKLCEEFPMSVYAQDAMYRNGVAAFGMGDFEKSRSVFEGFIDSYPEHELRGEVEFFLGDIYAGVGAVEKAMKHYMSVETYTKNMAFIDNAYSQAAKLLHTFERYDEEFNLMSSYAEKFPKGNVSEAYYSMARAKELLGFPSDALNLYINTIRNCGNNPADDGVDKVILDFKRLYDANYDKLKATIEFLKDLLSTKAKTVTVEYNGEKIKGVPELLYYMIEVPAKRYRYFEDHPLLDKGLYQKFKRDSRYGAALYKDRTALKELLAQYEHQLATYPQGGADATLKKLLEEAKKDNKTTLAYRLMMGLDNIGQPVKTDKSFTDDDIKKSSVRTLVWIGKQNYKYGADAARKAFKAALDRDEIEYRIDVMFALAELEEQEKRWDEVIKLYAQIERDFPTDDRAAMAAIRSADAYAKLGKRKEAYDKYEYILKVPSYRGEPYAEVLYKLGEIERVEGHTDKALMWFDRCYLGFANCYKWKGKAVLAALKLLAAQDRKAEARVICDEFINDAKNKASPDYEAVKQYRLVL